MKANAPKKIYCESDGLGNIVKVHNIKWPDDEAENIEYTRTDAFIEKAVSWLKEHREAVETEDNGIMGWIPDYFIENFKKNMEGE